MQKALIIGGTGTISAAVTRRLVNELGWDVWLLNRGNRADAMPAGAHQIVADIHDEAAAAAAIGDMTFDAVCEFVGFRLEDVERDYRLFKGKTKQYIYISSASAYNKPAPSYILTEGTSLANPHWQYSRDKIACEEFLMKKWREEGYPVTIVRPSHTYDERNLPLAVVGTQGCWQVLKRMLDGKPVIVHGDGSSLWTVTFNKDFAVGYTGLMGNPHALGEAFQITGDESLSWDQIYGNAAAALGVEFKPYHVSSDFLAATGDHLGFQLEGNLVGDKTPCAVFDNSKLKRLVPDMRTTIRCDQGFRITVNNILAHPELQRPDPVFDEWCDRVIAAQEEARAKVLG